MLISVFLLIFCRFCILEIGLAFSSTQLGALMTVPHIPARYDHVGSFLRPAYLLEAREQKAKGQITPEQLRVVEDKAITEIVKFQ